MQPCASERRQPAAALRSARQRLLARALAASCLGLALAACEPRDDPPRPTTATPPTEQDSVAAAKESTARAVEAAKEAAIKSGRAAKDVAAPALDATRDAAARAVQAAKEASASALEAGKAAAGVAAEKAGVVAAHLSRHNNRADLAQLALAAVLGCAADAIPVADQDAGVGWHDA